MQKSNKKEMDMSYALLIMDSETIMLYVLSEIGLYSCTML